MYPTEYTKVINTSKQTDTWLYEWRCKTIVSNGQQDSHSVVLDSCTFLIYEVLCTRTMPQTLWYVTHFIFILCILFHQSYKNYRRDSYLGWHSCWHRCWCICGMTKRVHSRDCQCLFKWARGSCGDILRGCGAICKRPYRQKVFISFYQHPSLRNARKWSHLAIKGKRWTGFINTNTLCSPAWNTQRWMPFISIPAL